MGNDSRGRLEELAEILGHRFTESGLLHEALTHQSAVPSRDTPDASYQRLEFLGDRVLGLVVAELLMARFPDEPEGDLARRLAALVRKESLTLVAEEIELSRFLVLAKGEIESGEHRNPSLLADSCEAVIGALYLDGGLAPAQAFIVRFWTPLLESAEAPPQDSKTKLQEWAQGRGLPLPDYREVGRRGPDHGPIFSVEVTVKGAAPAQGEGRSKRLAEQAAARALLEALDSVSGS